MFSCKSEQARTSSEDGVGQVNFGTKKFGHKILSLIFSLIYIILRNLIFDCFSFVHLKSFDSAAGPKKSLKMRTDVLSLLFLSLSMLPKTQFM